MRSHQKQLIWFLNNRLEEGFLFDLFLNIDFPKSIKITNGV